MASRTQIICLHEGAKGHSVDPVFINCLVRTLNPAWIRPYPGNSLVRLIGCGGRTAVISKLPSEIKFCMQAGGNTTLMVWADIDDDTEDAEELKHKFWTEAQKAGITQEEFDLVVFIFAKDRIENWIEFLLTGATDETQEGPRVSGAQAADAARQLAKRCQQSIATPPLPPSLQWSCRNWRALVERMKNL